MTCSYRFTEYIRPWKLTTLFLGIGLLILGSVYTPAPDWDIAISLIMAIFTYPGIQIISATLMVERREVANC